MKRFLNLAVVAAMSSPLFGVQWADAAFVQVIGGATYNNNPDVLTGYTSANMRTGASNAGNGVAVSSGTFFNGGAFSGSFAQRFSAAGATVLGNLGTAANGSTSTAVNWVNATGTSVGYAQKYSGTTDLGVRAVRWDANNSAAVELQTLGTTPAGVGRSSAYYIGPDGSAAGYAYKYTGGTGVGDRAVRWDAAGNVTELGTIGYPEVAAGGSGFGGFPSTYVTAMNNSGVAGGQVATPSNGTRPVRWNAAGAATELGNLGTNLSGVTFGSVYALNDSGTAVGAVHAYNASGADLDNRAVRWNAAGVVTELANLGTYTSGSTVGKVTSYAIAINNDGVVAGYASKTSSSDIRAVRWGTDGSITELGTLFPTVTTNFSLAYSINSAGLTVGSARSATGVNRAVLWGADGVAVDLNSLIDPTIGWTLQSAYTITDTNWVSGTGLFDPDGAGSLPAYTRAFLIQVPAVIPEPGALSLAVPAIALGVRRTRRVQGER